MQHKSRLEALLRSFAPCCDQCPWRDSALQELAAFCRKTSGAAFTCRRQWCVISRHIPGMSAIRDLCAPGTQGMWSIVWLALDDEDFVSGRFARIIEVV